MAELIGAISAGIGIATFAVQVGKGIKTVQKAVSYNRHHVSADLKSLESDLKNLHKVIEDLREARNNDLVTSAVANCQHAYIGLEPDLDRLTQAFGNDQPTKRSFKALKTRLTLNSEERVRKMRAKVSQIVDSLILISIFVKQIETIAAVQRGPVSPVIPDVTPAIEPAPSPGTSASATESSGPENRAVIQRSRSQMRQVDACYHKQTTYAKGRFWWLELTSTPGFWHKCGPRCPARCEWNAKLRLALTWLSIPWAVTASFGMTSSNGQYTLRPALSIQHVVKNTSPGFLALWLCEIYAISVGECKQRLHDLCRTDDHFRNHVNPEGKGYLRHLVHYPWQNQNLQFELLEFLVTETGLDFSSEDPRLLIECSKWIGEGRHLCLLDTVLEHGFSPHGIDAPPADQWPEPSNPDWISEMLTPDPFFLEYFKTIVSSEPGFTGVTELQKHILTGTFHALLDSGGKLPKKEQVLSTVNFLGQSSLHLAVRNIHMVKKLVELGHDLHVTDRWGTTPLMYAAAMGCEDVAIYLLLEGGLSEDSLHEARFGRTFLHFAMIRGHWSLVHKALSVIQDVASQDIHQAFAELVVIEAMTSSLSMIEEDARRQHIPLVIQHCGDVNLTLNDHQRSVTGNNLMHYVRSIEEAEALVTRGFSLFNQPNSAGRLPMHSLTFDPALIRFCVKHGTIINHVDSSGQTLLLILLSQLGDFNLRRSHILRQIRCAVHMGADTRHSDECHCPCSPSGCCSSAFFANGSDSDWLAFTSLGHTADFFWIFEWQFILQEFHGEDAVKDFLLSFLRRIEFDELGMTHVCCHKGSGIPIDTLLRQSWPKKLDDENICDILEEETELIDMLDETMRELASKSVKELQRYLLDIFKNRHAQHLQRNAEKRAKNLRQTMAGSGETKFGWHVDYKKDMYWQKLHISASFSLRDYSIPKRLATYIVYIDLESSLIHDPASQGPQRNAWYSRRLRLVNEITEVFGESIAHVVEYVEDAVAFAGLELDDNTGNKIKDRCIAFFQASKPSMD